MSTAKKKLTVAVLAGGTAAEREVSLRSGANVTAAVRELGHTVREYDPATDLAKLMRDAAKIDVVLPILHGRRGEDGALQGLLELLQLPYAGCDVLSSARAFRKPATKEAYRVAKLPIAKGIVVSRDEEDVGARIKKEVGFPCFVKPANEGSSYGASRVMKVAELPAALESAFKYDAEVLVEQYLAGTEISVGVLEGEGWEMALPVAEIRTKHAFFDLESKYDPELAEEICPAPLSKSLTEKAQKLAIAAHRALGCRDLSRTDMIIVGTKLFLLETNTLPGLTPVSLLPKMVAAIGWSFSEFVEHLIQRALRRASR